MLGLRLSVASALALALPNLTGLIYDPALTAQGLALASDLAQFPPNLQSSLNIDATVGMKLRMQISTTFPIPDDAPSYLHTITNAERLAGAFSWGSVLASILAGTHYFRQRLETGTTFGAWGAVVMHGDASLPAMTGPTTLSTAELNPMAFALATSQPSTLLIGGPNGSAIELASTAAASSFLARLVSNALLDADASTGGASTIVFTATPINLAGVYGSPVTYTQTVVDVDDSPDTPVFTPNDSATVGTPAISNTITVSGLGAGVSAIITVPAGLQYSKNGGAFTAAAGRVANTDTIALGYTPAIAGRTYLNVQIGTVSAVYRVTTAGFAPQTTGTWAAGVGGSTLSESGKLATGNGAGNDGSAFTDFSFARLTTIKSNSATAIKYYVEVEVVSYASGKAIDFGFSRGDGSFAAGSGRKYNDTIDLVFGAAGGAFGIPKYAAYSGGPWSDSSTNPTGMRIGAELSYDGGGPLSARFSKNGVFGEAMTLAYEPSMALFAMFSAGASLRLVSPNYQPAGTTLIDPDEA